MQCPRCGATVVARAHFCPVCGQPLVSDAGAVATGHVTSRVYPATPFPTLPLAGDDALVPNPPATPTPPTQAHPVVRQWQRWWWKILLIGMGLYLAVNSVFLRTQNAYLLPQLFMIGAFLVPVAYIAYLYEDGTLYDVPLSKIALIFFFGGVVGSLVATLLEARLITSDTRGLFGQLTLLNATIVGFSEELAKLVVLIPFLLMARRRYPSVMHGIVLGAAAGMGFAAFESMGYAFGTLIESRGNLDIMNQVIGLRALLAPLGHGTWTAIIAAALWREQISQRFALNANVLVGFLVAVILHLLWDWVGLPLTIGGLPVIHILLGIVGLLILRFFLVVAKGGQGAAYQERNLAAALRLYASDLRHTTRGVLSRKQRP
ncbi:MAG: PrsW family intramembrane metalloprotease [Herpetosiphonaceae bacterium]|nr:PrsW family intramembrane metalloprotease [Herpetosiphonaceae bacterium]